MQDVSKARSNTAGNPGRAAVEQHFKDIGHDPEDHGVTYAKILRQERTQVLMDVANQTGGIADRNRRDMSELAPWMGNL